MEKILSSKTKIRFQDCDPFNHLNNSRYIDYMINAREDQVMEFYNLDIFALAQKQGKVWVVGTNQIAYIKPALTMETVVIESQILGFSNRSLQVENRMWNEEMTELKAILWVGLVHYDLFSKTVANHSEDLLKLFGNVVNPVAETSFEERLKTMRALHK
jgi:thioesterase III